MMWRHLALFMTTLLGITTVFCIFTAISAFMHGGAYGFYFGVLFFVLTMIGTAVMVNTWQSRNSPE